MCATFPRRDDGEAWASAIELRIHRGEAIHGDTRATKTFNGLIDLHRNDLAKVGKAQGRPKIAGLAFGTLRSPEAGAADPCRGTDCHSRDTMAAILAAVYGLAKVRVRTH